MHGLRLTEKAPCKLVFENLPNTRRPTRMIPRYSRPEMTAIWEPENKYRIWFEIEAHACDAQAALGVIPESAAKAVWKKGAWEIDRIEEIERETRHDVIAFLTTSPNI